jgi:RNA polymerase sigma-70 factor (ECF subfamily)
MWMAMEQDHARFESLAMPHLNAAYNLARWLTHNDHDAEDVVHESVIRAMRYIGSFRGDSARAWLLQIVRNTTFSWLRENRSADVVALDDNDDSWQQVAAPSAEEPPALAMRNAERRQINDAIAALPVVYREALVLRELEDLSYAEIARIADVPIGTVMSRLARARALMREALIPSARPALRPVPRVVNGGNK